MLKTNVEQTDDFGAQTLAYQHCRSKYTTKLSWSPCIREGGVIGGQFKLDGITYLEQEYTGI